MKKSILFFVSIFFAFAASSQSIPNPGFESWLPNPDYDDPEGWGTLNLLSIPGFDNPASVFKDSIAPYAGNYSLKITTVVLVNNPAPDQLADTFGVAFSGMVSFAGQVLGFPYSLKPTTLNFYYKYTPVDNDTALCNVQLFKYNTTTHMRDTLASGYFSQNNTVSNYTMGSVTLNYNAQFAGLDPDTAMITFQPSNDFVPIPGSTLWVDELSFTGGVGIDDLASSKKDVLVYPNPAVNELTIVSQNENGEKVIVFDEAGRMLTSILLVNKTAKVDLHSYQNGNYFYRITDKDEAIITSGKFSIAR